MESVEAEARAEKKMRGVSRASETVEKAALPLFRMDDSCCAQNLTAFGSEIPHLQTEKCFQSRTCRG